MPGKKAQTERSGFYDRGEHLGSEGIICANPTPLFLRFPHLSAALRDDRDP